jgi:hypothetical protein
MADIAETRMPSLSARDARRADAGSVMYWISLGAAAGGAGGALIGGVGGRLAMFLLRLTSDPAVRGIESDDGFVIGRFDVMSTLGLLLLTTILGAIVGLIVIAGRPFLPRKAMPVAWAVAGAIAGGALLIHQDGVDFNALDPPALAIALFIAIPAAGAGLIAWLTEVYPRFWWKRRKLTALAALAGLPVVAVFPVAIGAALVGVIWWLAMQFPLARRMPGWKPARAAALVVFALVMALGLNDLARDVHALV